MRFILSVLRRHGATLLPLGVAFLTLGVLLASAWPSLRPVATVRVAPAVYVQDQVRETDERPIVQAPGWLEAEPFYTACAALTDGVIASVDVLEGDQVEAGQVVATLIREDAELNRDRQRAARDVAQAVVARRQAELQAAQLDWDHPIERERAVATSAASLREAEAALVQLPAEIRAAEALLIQFEEEREKAKRSLAFEAATDLEVTITSQQASAQAARIEVLQKRTPILEARVARLQAEHVAASRNLELRIEEARRLAEAKAALLAAEAARAEADARLGEAELALSRMVIHAPISGYVQKRLKVPGDKVMRMNDNPHSLHVLHLYDPQRLQVRVDIPLADARHVFVGQRCEVTVEVLPQTQFVGEVLRITHEADLQKNTLQAKVRVIDPSPLLRPEMLTRVRFLPDNGAASTDTTTPAPGLRIPPEVLERGQQGPRVWTVRERRGPRGVLEPVAVEVMQQNSDFLTVRGALHPGELLVIEPRAIEAGQQVEVTRG